MSKFFNSSENKSKQLAKNRLRNRYNRELQRRQILKSCQHESDRRSASSKLSELLATQVVTRLGEYK